MSRGESGIRKSENGGRQAAAAAWRMPLAKASAWQAILEIVIVWLYR